MALPPGIGLTPDREPVDVRAVGRVVLDEYMVLEGGVGGTASAKSLIRA